MDMWVDPAENLPGQRSKSYNDMDSKALNKEWFIWIKYSIKFENLEMNEIG